MFLGLVVIRLSRCWQRTAQAPATTFAPRWRRSPSTPVGHPKITVTAHGGTFAVPVEINGRITLDVRLISTP